MCWLPYSWWTDAWALLANHVLFMGINCYGWWKWARRPNVHTPGETPPVSDAEEARREAYALGFEAGREATLRDT